MKTPGKMNSSVGKRIFVAAFWAGSDRRRASIDGSCRLPSWRGLEAGGSSVRLAVVVRADALMAGNERRGRLNGPVPVCSVDVGVAQPARLETHQHLAGADQAVCCSERVIDDAFNIGSSRPAAEGTGQSRAELLKVNARFFQQRRNALLAKRSQSD